MLDLIIVRHGQSVADIEKRMEGRADFPLTDLGKEQSEKLACWLKQNIIFDCIISSPLKRASETSKIISELCLKDITYDERLMEWNNGVIAGLLISEANNKYPIPDGGRKYFQRITEGESVIDFRARIEEFIAELLNKYAYSKDDKKILIVTHGGVINMIFHSFLNLPIKNEVSICSGYTSVHILRAIGDKRNIISVNRNEHLK
jgi:2,3-bisphosphoglycerate-dependent phosphoglycerate mutase